MNAAEKTRCLHRLLRIEGQVGGVLRMIESDRELLDVLAQIQSAQGALRSLEIVLLGCALTDCIERGNSGPAETTRHAMGELIQVFGKRLPP